MRKKPFLKIAVAVGIAAALLAAAAWLSWSRTARGPAAAPSSAPRGGVAGAVIAPATPIRLPSPPPGPVESLREKVAAGNDRFLVEAADEALEPRLSLLAGALRAPLSAGASAAFEEVLAPRIGVRDLIPEREVTILERDGIAVFRAERGGTTNEEGGAAGTAAAGAEVAPAGFGALAARLIAPLRRLESASFKVVEIDGALTAGALRSTVFYELHGGGEGERREWSGTAVLSWTLERGGETKPGASWRLARWETREALRSLLATKPFADVTADSLGANPAHGALLERSIDHFRDRLDAATGIDVYGHHGLAAGDADGDGIDDLYVAMPPGLPNLLLLGRGDGTFADASAESRADVLDGTHHPIFADADNDGDEDLILVTETGPILVQNDGRGRFSLVEGAFPDVSRARSTPISACVADYDLDGFVDVYVCSYVFWRGTAGGVGSRLPFPYHEARNGAPNFLFRNRRNGTFEDVTERSGLDVDNNRFSFAASWGDYDGDGDPDLFVANDFGSKNLYRNNGNGTFTETTREAGVEDVGAGMSVAWEDYDNDGDLDLYVGNMLSSAGRRVTGTSDYKRDNPELQKLYRRHARGNSLFRNRGDGTFEEVSEPTRAFFGRWAWASGFIDFNLDGREDIFVQNGFISGESRQDL